MGPAPVSLTSLRKKEGRRQAEGRSCEDTKGRRPSKSQEEGPQKKPKLQPPES